MPVLERLFPVGRAFFVGLQHFHCAARLIIAAGYALPCSPDKGMESIDARAEYKLARIVIIGGSGHVGSYLVPRLVDLGYEVVNVSRGVSKPYRPHYAWHHIENISLDRPAEEKAGLFGNKIAALKPDIVLDMISFDLPSTQQLVEALRGKIEHYVFCSTIWVYGRLSAVPSTEEDNPNPIDSYGTNKAEIEAWLMREARSTGFPATCFRPGHIVGEGWDPINPIGNQNPAVFSQIARGEELVLPNLGLETVHHVHADDVAEWIICALANRGATIGEVFNTVSGQALQLRGYAEAAYRWFGREPRLAFKPFDEWILGLGAWAESTSGHIIRSSCHSIEKSRMRLGYRPRFTSLEAVHQSVQYSIAAGRITVPGIRL
jgi:nucleoside-diphosphate-sugar epimerase